MEQQRNPAVQCMNQVRRHGHFLFKTKHKSTKTGQNKTEAANNRPDTKDDESSGKKCEQRKVGHMAIIKSTKEMTPTPVNSKTELNTPRPTITSSEQKVTPMNLLTLDDNGVFMWPNDDHHQRWEPAAERSRIVTHLTGWLPSAEWCGWLVC